METEENMRAVRESEQRQIDSLIRIDPNLYRYLEFEIIQGKEEFQEDFEYEE